MTKANKTVSSRRLNLRAAIIMGVVVLVLVPGFFAYKAYQERYHRALFFREAQKRLELNQPYLALQYLNRYLALRPDDIDALDLKGKILADSARSASQAIEAMPIHNQVLGRDPENPKRQETRRRLAELNLRTGRTQAAEGLARELLRRGAKDAATHRLLAEALEGIGTQGNAKALDEACREYETAEQIEPGDVRGTERLARLYRDKLNNPQKALAVLDHLIAINGKVPAKSAAAHLVRARYFASAPDPGRAAGEIAEALKADPKSVDVRIAAAEDANKRGDVAAARKHLDAIPADVRRTELRVKLAEGIIELAEQRPDEAIQSWRSGLLQVGGNSADLTFRLAHVLLEIGRVREAEPLIAQYRRLVGGDEPDAVYHYLNGFALLRDDRPDEAIAALETVRYKAPKPLEHLVDLLLGECYERAGNAPKAIDAYVQATKVFPQSISAWLAIANLQAAESPNDAARTLEHALAVNPNDPRLLARSALLVWRQQVQLPSEQRSWGEVERTLAEAEKAAPNSLELALARADCLEAAGKSDEALARIETALKVHPKSAALQLARANLLNRGGHAAQAQNVLDQAVADNPQADLFVLRAAVLLARGQGKRARTSLHEGLARVPEEQRPRIWKALGELASAQNDNESARAAFQEWAKLQPDSAEPRAMLLGIAMASGNESAIRSAVDALKEIGGPQAPYWRVARAEELLRDRPGTPGNDPKEAERLDEAAGLIREVESNQPHLAAGFLLEGRLCEKRKQVDRAIAAYEKALEKKGGGNALTPLVTLLVREHRDADLERVRKAQAALPREVDRLATVQALKTGNKDLAEQLAARMVQGDPGGFDANVWQARVLNELGKPEEAEAGLRRLIDRHPDQPAPYRQLLILQLSRKQVAQAKATVEQMRQRVKTEKAELLWALSYRGVGDQRQADFYHREALKRWPDDPAVLTAVADYAEQTARPAEAEAALRHLLEREPGNAWAVHKLAQLLALRPANRAAWEEALRLIGPGDRPNDTADDRLVRARVYALSMDPQQRKHAIVILEELASEMPTAAAVHEPLARLLRGAGKLDEATTHAAKAAEGENANPDAILLYANILIDGKALDEAERQTARLDALDPYSPAVAEMRARILVAKGRDREAAAGLERAFAAKADSPAGLAIGEKMLELLVKLKQLDAAERVAQRLGRIGSKGACAYATFLARQGKPNDAAAQLDAAAKAGALADAGNAALTLAHDPSADPRWLTRADGWLGNVLKQQPRSIDLLEKMARVRYLQGRFEDQMAFYRTLLAQKPSDVTFLNDMAWTLSEDLHRPSEGLERLNEALSRIGPDPNLHDTRGVILLRLKKLDDAIKDLEAAAQGMPIAPVYYHLARAYREKGRQDDYLKAREHAKQLGLRPDQLQPSERAGWNAVMEGT